MAIEVDGNIHAEKSVAQYDKDRQEYLESQELNFLRFTNDQVEQGLALVIEELKSTLLIAAIRIIRIQNEGKPL